MNMTLGEIELAFFKTQRETVKLFELLAGEIQALNDLKAGSEEAKEPSDKKLKPIKGN